MSTDRPYSMPLEPISAINASSNKSWLFILIGFVLYCTFFVLNRITQGYINNRLGFLIFILFVSLAALGRLNLTDNNLTRLVILIVIDLLIPIFYSYENINLDSMIKYLGFLFIFLISLSSSFAAMDANRYRKFFILIIIILILSSFFFENMFVGGEERMAGVFKNPNNLALFAFSLLFFLNEKKDNTLMKTFIYIAIVLILIISATTGAIIAFLIGISYKLFMDNAKRKYSYLVLGLVAFFLLANFIEIPIINRIKTQFTIVLNEGGVLSSPYSKIDYGYLANKYGVSGYTSGLYRIDLWRTSVYLFGQQNTKEKLFGIGTGGSINLIQENLPHNEYIRLLLETGFVGLFLYALLFIKLFQRSRRGLRYIYVIFAVFCFTENIFDNMIFMSLFALFLSSSVKIAIMAGRRAQSRHSYLYDRIRLHKIQY